MKKLVLAFGVIFALAGCGKIDQMKSHYTGQPSEICVHGVSYLQFTSGSSVAYTREGKIKTCD